MMRWNPDSFYEGYRDRQFILFFICEDPWQYLRNFRIPNEIIVISGMRELKRKSEDIETLVVADKFSWLSKINSEFFVCEESLRNKIIENENTLPIPFLKGSVGKTEITIIRDPINYHPIYYSRLPDGFIVTTRKEWILKIGYMPREITDKNVINVSQETLKLSTVRLSTSIKTVDKLKAIEVFISNIKKAYEILSENTNKIYLVASGEIGDLVISKLLPNITLVCPSAINKIPKSFTSNLLQIDISDHSKRKSLLEKLSEKSESENTEILLIGLLIELLKKHVENHNKVLIINGVGLNHYNNLYNELHDVFKATWPSLTVPLILAGNNIDLIQQNKIRKEIITNYLNIEESIMLEYQSYFEKILDNLDS